MNQAVVPKIYKGNQYTLFNEPSDYFTDMRIKLGSQMFN